MSAEQQRAAELLHQAADALLSTAAATTCTSTTTPTSSTSITHHATALRAIFSPYSRSAGGTSGRQTGSRRSTSIRTESVGYWTHRFCVIPKINQDTAPNREEKQRLFNAGLGERRITFVKDGNPETFRNKLEETYPALKGCGGFELLRSSATSRIVLEHVNMPQTGYCTSFLANDSNLGQAVCYIRPIQRDVSEEIMVEDSADAVTQDCFTCNQKVPLSRFRQHLNTCAGATDDSNVCNKV